MKAKFKKIVAALLSAMMVLTMCVATNVHAAGTGTIKITSANYKLDPTDYEAYNLFNVTKTGDDKYGYTSISKEITDTVAAAVNAAAGGTVVTVNANEDITANDIVAYLTKEGNATADFMVKFSKALEKNKAKLGTPKTAAQVGETNDIQFTGLDNGYYVVIDKTATDAEPKSAAMVKVVAGEEVSIPVKADLPTVDKEVVTDAEKPSFAIGDSIEFKLTGTTPSNFVLSTYTEYTYTFKDTLSKGLTIADPVTLTITVDGETYSQDKVTVNQATEVSGETTLTVEFDLKEAAIQEILEKQADGMHTIVITYSAKLNENAVIGKEGNPNDVFVQYSNNPDTTDKGKTEKDEVKVYSFGIDITKQDDKGALLKDAEFELYKDDGNETFGEEDALLYFVNGKLVTSDAEGATTTLISDGDGKITVQGLDAGKYFLKETKAPDGYNLLTDVEVIDITPTYGETVGKDHEKTLTNLAKGDIATGLVAVTVINKAGLVLPETGGMGTTILYLVGILAMAGGVCYFVMDKRRKAQVK